MEKLLVKYAEMRAVMRTKARGIMFTTLVLLGLLQMVAGAIMDIILYAIAIAVVMFFTKILRA